MLQNIQNQKQSLSISNGLDGWLATRPSASKTKMHNVHLLNTRCDTQSRYWVHVPYMYMYRSHVPITEQSSTTY